MGRNRKDYDDDFKMEVVRESLKKNAVDAEVATRYYGRPQCTIHNSQCTIELKMVVRVFMQ